MTRMSIRQGSELDFMGMVRSQGLTGLPLWKRWVNEGFGQYQQWFGGSYPPYEGGFGS